MQKVSCQVRRVIFISVVHYTMQTVSRELYNAKKCAIINQYKMQADSVPQKAGFVLASLLRIQFSAIRWSLGLLDGDWHTCQNWDMKIRDTHLKCITRPHLLAHMRE